MSLFRLDTLEITNFRGFERFTLHLDPRMTILHADNGGGKTSLLAALAVGMGGWFSDLGGVPKRSIFAREVRCVDRSVAGRIERVEHYPVIVHCTGEVADAPIDWWRSLGRAGRATTTKGLTKLTARVRALVRELSRTSDVGLPVLALYGTQRLFSQARDTARRQPNQVTRLYGYLDCLNPASNEKQLLQWLYHAAMAEFQRGQRLPEFDAVRHAVLGALGGNFLDFRYDAQRREPCLVLEDGSSEPWDRISDGYHTFIGMVADIAWRAALLNPHLGADAAATAEGLVGIDEIDLHLHPSWQRRVLGDLMRVFPRIQFVVTTHSPQVLGSAQRQWLRGIRPDTTEAEVDVPIEGRDTNAILTDVMGTPSRAPEMERQLDQLFDLIDGGERSAALDLLDKIADKLGLEDTEIVRARALLHEG